MSFNNLQISIKKTVSNLTEKINFVLNDDPTPEFLAWLADEMLHITKTIELLVPEKNEDDCL